jgi:hypothetical protein
MLCVILFNVTYKPFVLSVVRLNVVTLSVVALHDTQHNEQSTSSVIMLSEVAPISTLKFKINARDLSAILSKSLQA